MSMGHYWGGRQQLPLAVLENWREEMVKKGQMGGVAVAVVVVVVVVVVKFEEEGASALCCGISKFFSKSI